MRCTIYGVIFIFLLSCTSSKQVTKLVEMEDSSIHSGIPTEEHIAFINLKIAADSIAHTNKVEMINVNLIKGHLKSNDAGDVRSNNYLTCILYEDSKSVDTIRIEHPLYRTYEYKNENNEMSVKEVKNKEAEFFLRFQLKKGKATQVKIIETLNGILTGELATISL